MSALVISRRPGEEIIIDGPARILIADSSHGRVKVRIEADKDVKILRGELEERDGNTA